ncbi:hypothetical protein [Sphingomonas sp. PB4P5]|uniref:hypothetical protein n=1 Tax=Parasphingomonas puruogangriensis TaxID=3096155 RepID=UPI002FC78EDC
MNCLAQASEPAAAVDAQAQRRVPDDIVRLSDEERNDILDSNTPERAATARGERRAIHGEVGAMIGSHGARGAYGVAEVPLGDNAGVVVSFESSRIGRSRR